MKRKICRWVLHENLNFLELSNLSRKMDENLLRLAVLLLLLKGEHEKDIFDELTAKQTDKASKE